MPSLNEIRKKYPQYNDMSDQEFADKFHDKFYSDIPKEEYYNKLGFSPKIDKSENKESKSFLGKSAEFAKKYINEPVESLTTGANEASSGYLQGLSNIGPGLYNLGAKVANLIPGVNVEEKKEYNFAPHTANAMLGELGSFFGPGILGKIPELANIPSHISNIPHVANALKKASEIIGKSPKSLQKTLKGLTSKTGKSIGSNALLGAVMSPEQQGLGSALGAGGAALGAGLGYGVPKIANKLGIYSHPGTESFEHLKPEDVKESFEAGKRLGTPLTPSETTGDTWAGGIEGAFKRSKKGSFENVKLGKERVQNEKKAIGSFLENIYDKSTSSDNNIKNLYKNAYKWNLKPEIVNELKKDPIILNAFKEVSKDPAWQSSLGRNGINENNYEFLDKVRDAIYNKKNELTVSGQTKKSNPYQSQYNKLTEIMDKSVPIYEKARNAAELKITRNNIEDQLKKNIKKVSGSEFFKKFIQNDNKFDELKMHLRNAPKAIENLEDMKKAWHSLVNLDTNTGRSFKTEIASNQTRNTILELYQKFKDLTGLSDSKKAIKYLRSGKWYDDFVNAANSKDKNRLEDTLSDIMGKIIPGGIESIKEGND